MPAELDKELRRLKSFHGHLGPYVTIGYKMGKYAIQLLGKNGLRVVAKTGTDPPISCILDGIQVSTGCTLGKGTLVVFNEKRPEAIFRTDEKKIVISLRPHLWREIELRMSKETELKDSLKIYRRPENELFDIED